MKFLKGLGIILGLMFGAGIFALPFAISQSGIFWGIFHLLAAMFINLMLLFLYAEVAHHTKGKHRFTGYVELILGKKYKKFSFIITMAAYYGTLLAYAVLGGLFLHNLFSFSSLAMTYLFFIISGALLLLRLERVALISFYLTIPLFAFVIYLLFKAQFFIDLNNFSLTGASWFLPYGVWIFSLCAIAAIPEARDIFSSSSLRSFKKTILVSVLLSVVFYCLFIFSIVGISGDKTTQDAFLGVLNVLGSRVILLGSIMGFLAVFTSFLVLGIDLRGIFRYDFGLSKITAWFLVMTPSLLLFYLGFQDFTRIISLVGSIGIGITGTFIILMARKLRGVGRAMEIIILVSILSAVAYEVINLL